MGPQFLALIAGAAPSFWPFAVLVISLAAIVILITVLRVHAFLALVLVAFLAALLAEKLPGEYGTLPNDPTKERSHWIQAVELTTAEFGNTAGKIGVVIALASVIGMCLMESGAADKVVRRFIAVFGEKRAGAAIAREQLFPLHPDFFRHVLHAVAAAGARDSRPHGQGLLALRDGHLLWRDRHALPACAASGTAGDG